jgi:hypothetical protein
VWLKKVWLLKQIEKKDLVSGIIIDADDVEDLVDIFVNLVFVVSVSEN